MDKVHTVVLCTFHPLTGWRISGVSLSKFERPGVFKMGKYKFLRIPTITPQTPGRFCNPKTIALDFVRNKDH